MEQQGYLANQWQDTNLNSDSLAPDPIPNSYVNYLSHLCIPAFTS